MAEEKEEKKPEEQEYPKPWFHQKIDGLINLDEAGNEEELKLFLQNFFEQLSQYYLDFRDVLDSIHDPSKQHAFFRALSEYNINYLWVFNRLKMKTLKIIIDVWLNKYESIDPEKRNRATDKWFLDSLGWLTEEILSELFSLKTDIRYLFRLPSLGQYTYKDDPDMLVKLANVLDQTRGRRYAIDFRARAQALQIKEEIKVETREEVKSIVSEETKKFSGEIKVETNSALGKLKQELNEGLKEAKENEKRMTRNFVQIIGIFAAIIAFVVAIVPTAVRMGGASIPIALAGLAIVTLGIVILLALIFGNPDAERRKRLNRGFWGVVAAFGLWLAVTLVLVFAKPEALRPPADPSRVDTLYIDTVESTAPPAPSIEEGE